jgi:hypothetical protein
MERGIGILETQDMVKGVDGERLYLIPAEMRAGKNRRAIPA